MRRAVLAAVAVTLGVFVVVELVVVSLACAFFRIEAAS